jgi:hypothetical protein
MNDNQVAHLHSIAKANPKYLSFGFLTFNTLLSTTKARQVTRS